MLAISTVIQFIMFDPFKQYGDTVVSNNAVEKIKFKYHPNVYFCILESHSSPNGLRTIFGYDSSNFVHSLQERGFEVADNLFSSYDFTVSTLQGWFSMKHHFYRNLVGLDNAMLRGMLDGQIYNPVYYAFKHNGYYIQCIWPDNEYYKGLERSEKDPRWAPQKSLYLCKCPAHNNTIPNAFMFGQICQQKIYNLLRIKTTQNNFIKIDLQQIFPQIINDAIENRPTLSIYKPIDTFHSDVVPDKELFEEQYIKAVKLSEKHRISEIDEILKQDPTAIIVLVADHGPITARGAIWHYARKKSWPQDIPSTNPAEYVALDTLGIFYAVRVPDNLPQPGFPKSNIEVFPVIFNVLGAEPSTIPSIKRFHFYNRAFRFDPDTREILPYDRRTIN